MECLTANADCSSSSKSLHVKISQGNSDKLPRKITLNVNESLKIGSNLLEPCSAKIGR